MDQIKPLDAVGNLTAQRDELAQCVHFALSWLHSKGSGLLMDRSDPTATEYKMEHWTTWFIRTMETVGAKYDLDILDFQRSSQTDRKKMLKANPALQEKLNKTTS